MDRRLALLFVLLLMASPARAQEQSTDTSYGDQMVRAYFEDQVRQIESGWLADVQRAEDWEAQRPQRRRELLDMLGLDPLPPRTDLKATVTGVVEHPEFIVEKLHFQSMPGLYVTANLYLPRDAQGPLPGILYLNGHANLRDEHGVSLGSKTAYQRHPAWYARHGYVCLIIDTIQLAEIEGVHHGTYRMDRWWWWNRGYTPAGVETWNALRALDYLETRPEVDPTRLAVTGRSGGGAYAWFVLGVDDRVQAAVPTAGITDLRNHVLDGTVTSHCDCMFMLNSARWDFPLLAALAAPRPTLLANGDVDPLFPLDGVERIFHKTRPVYALYDRLASWQSLIVEAGHADIPPLQQGTYRWMHRHLRQEELTEQDSVVSYFEPAMLKVFAHLPEDEINTRIDELFVPAAPEPAVPASWAAWQAQRRQWQEQLRAKSFGGWPAEAAEPEVEEAYSAVFEGLRLSAYDFESQQHVRLRLWVLQADGADPAAVSLAVVDSAGWQAWLGVLGALAGEPTVAEALVGPGARASVWPEADADRLAGLRGRLQESEALAVLAPRGVGPTQWQETERGYGIRRSFMLLGQTRDGMRVWDIRRAVQALGTVAGLQETKLRLEGAGVMGALALYASIFEERLTGLELYGLPAVHREGPILLQVRKVLEMPQALALGLAPGRDVRLAVEPESPWAWTRAVSNLAPGGERLLHFTADPPWLVSPEASRP